MLRARFGYDTRNPSHVQNSYDFVLVTVVTYRTRGVNSMPDSPTSGVDPPLGAGRTSGQTTLGPATPNGRHAGGSV